jgi:hypothetical protein
MRDALGRNSGFFIRGSETVRCALDLRRAHLRGVRDTPTFLAPNGLAHYRHYRARTLFPNVAPRTGRVDGKAGTVIHVQWAVSDSGVTFGLNIWTLTVTQYTKGK